MILLISKVSIPGTTAASYYAIAIFSNSLKLNAMRINKLVDEVVDHSYKKIKRIIRSFVDSSDCCSECDSECSMCCEHHHHSSRIQRAHNLFDSSLTSYRKKRLVLLYFFNLRI